MGIIRRMWFLILTVASTASVVIICLNMSERPNGVKLYQGGRSMDQILLGQDILHVEEREEKERPTKAVYDFEDDAPANYKNVQNYWKYFKYNNFTKMKFGSVFVYAVTMGNTSETAHWDIIKILASVGLQYTEKDKSRKESRIISCCLKYVNETGNGYVRVPTKFAYRRNVVTKLSTCHYTCLNPTPGVVPDGVAITSKNYTCSEEDVTYRKPDLPLREMGEKLALSAKIAYGSRSAELIIEFVEVYRYLGVDKIVVYFLEDLNEDAKKVLGYYASTGIVDAYFFVPADWENFKRRFHPPSPQSGSDKQLATIDSFEKMSGYKYFGVIDLDEFLIPSKGRSLKQLLADLYKNYTGAAGFTFRTQFFFTNWPQYGKVNDFILGRYITRTSNPPCINNKKSIYKPMYMNAGAIHTHKPGPTNKTAHPLRRVGSEHGYMRHYRTCYSRHGNCHKVRGGPCTDTSLADWSKRIENNVHDVRYRVFGNASYVNEKNTSISVIVYQNQIPLCPAEHITMQP